MSVNHYNAIVLKREAHFLSLLVHNSTEPAPLVWPSRWLKIKLLWTEISPESRAWIISVLVISARRLSSMRRKQIPVDMELKAYCTTQSNMTEAFSLYTHIDSLQAEESKLKYGLTDRSKHTVSHSQIHIQCSRSIVSSTLFSEKKASTGIDK